jgi:peptidoglycan-N-acetylglucosamine deacetylase
LRVGKSVFSCLCCLLLVFWSGAPFTYAAKKGRNYFEEKKSVVWEVMTEKRVVAITFDDGPNPTYTPEILDLLKKYQAKATFFVIGAHVKAHSDIVKREAAEGHELANHTYYHPLQVKRLSTEQIKKELTLNQEAVHSAIGKNPTLFRPPGGYYDERIVNAAVEKGYTVVIWSWDLNTQDYRKQNIDKMVNKVVSNIHNGGIILLHDHGGNRNHTIKALERILPALKQKGYRFVTVSELIKLGREKKGKSP